MEYEKGFCPFTKMECECNEGCAVYSLEFEKCAFLLLAESYAMEPVSVELVAKEAEK